MEFSLNLTFAVNFTLNLSIDGKKDKNTVKVKSNPHETNSTL